jgi:hypothetical protein
MAIEEAEIMTPKTWANVFKGLPPLFSDRGLALRAAATHALVGLQTDAGFKCWDREMKEAILQMLDCGTSNEQARQLLGNGFILPAVSSFIEANVEDCPNYKKVNRGKVVGIFIEFMFEEPDSEFRLGKQLEFVSVDELRDVINWCVDNAHLEIIDGCVVDGRVNVGFLPNNKLVEVECDVYGDTVLKESILHDVTDSQFLRARLDTRPVRDPVKVKCSISDFGQKVMTVMQSRHKILSLMPTHKKIKEIVKNMNDLEQNILMEIPPMSHEEMLVLRQEAEYHDVQALILAIDGALSRVAADSQDVLTETAVYTDISVSPIGSIGLRIWMSSWKDAVSRTRVGEYRKPADKTKKKISKRKWIQQKLMRERAHAKRLKTLRAAQPIHSFDTKAAKTERVRSGQAHPQCGNGISPAHIF